MSTIELIVRIIVKREDAVLLCVNKKGTYFLPGGHVEFGDTIEETIYKETKEELGWERDQIKSFSFKGYLENSFTPKDGTEPRHELNMIFDAEINENTPTQSQESHIDFQWVPLQDIKNIRLLPSAIIPFIL